MNKRRYLYPDINKNSKGFTLIEVVLVLAIGGLIFLLAFLAFSQAQKNRRDTQRRADAARIVAELQNYTGDSGSYPSIISSGPYPATIDICSGGTAPDFLSFTKKYMCSGSAQDTFLAPQGASNYINQASNNYLFFKTVSTNNVVYLRDYKCDNTVADSGVSSLTGSIAVVVGLEKGKICKDSQ